MTPAQKAAYVFAWYRQITTVTPVYPSYEFSDKICAPDDGWKPLYTQSALDAAAEQERAAIEKIRIDMLEHANEYLGGGTCERHMVATCLMEHAEELESLVKEK